MPEKSEVFEITYGNYVRKLADVNLKDRADRLGASFSNETLQIAFYGSWYYVSEKGVFDAEGGQTNFAISVVLCRYILQCPEQLPVNGGWVSYREFKDAGPLAGYFTSNTNKIIETQFGGNKNGLKAAGRKLGGLPYTDDTTYDLSMTFSALPRIPVLLRFNDRDDEFPAQTAVLFRQSAEAYLDMECLSIAGTYLAGHLIGN